MLRSLVGSEMCIRDRVSTQSTGTSVVSAMKLLSIALTLALLALSVHHTSGLRRDDDGDDTPDNQQTDPLESDAPPEPTEGEEPSEQAGGQEAEAAEAGADDGDDASKTPQWMSWVLGGLPLLLYGLWKWKPWQSQSKPTMPVVYSKCRWESCEVIQPNPFMRDQHEKICESRKVMHKRCKQQIMAKNLEAHKLECCDSAEQADEEEIDADE
eukprot:TRINITY_DN17604_c0_g1_i1.p1 TRINITY_DN17604_c0_g1~~TRINITY_DN17604_c0_g1_i1.p1  ORF type:complete len:212 (+),score=53.99 TRINITY_DN17604_c0_g1_i1:127-762(+)